MSIQACSWCGARAAAWWAGSPPPPPPPPLATAAAGALVDGRQVVDAADGEPWLSQDLQHAVSLLQAALDLRTT
ncbi:hypothetical protein J2S46_008017 [Kitasatospora herbaricolor]|uniref:hypothetical protein n=1 Tax=Kitasatospora herbaricolor TaxID=68217 RepID=UPI00278E8C1F|nr:hypothetical protein [Kitasatospora herbaricolor]MDQ0313364.1 hypothetical protein [Kitasatospora herbaricolor]